MPIWKPQRRRMRRRRPLPRPRHNRQWNRSPLQVMLLQLPLNPIHVLWGLPPVMVLAVGSLRWLWPHLGADMQLPVLAYIAAHWLITGFLLALVSPVFALMLNLSPTAMGTLAGSLLLGTAVLSLLGCVGASLTVGLKRGGMLISLLILPLYIPVLIFGTAAVQASVDGLPAAPYLAILAAMLSLAIALAPLAIAAGLRISLDA